MKVDTDVTRWIRDVLQRDEQAAQKLWDRYFPQLVRLARSSLPSSLRRVADEEDLAASALDSFFCAAAAGRFPQLNDRDNLWALLVVITRRKAQKQLERQCAQKRGGGDVRGESALEGEGGFEQFLSREPTPELAAILAEEVQVRLAGLDEGLRRIALWKMEGYSNQEIAQQLSCRADTISRKLMRIRDLWSAESKA